MIRRKLSLRWANQDYKVSERGPVWAETSSPVCFGINRKHSFVPAKAKLKCTRNMGKLRGRDQYRLNEGEKYRIVANGIGDKLSKGLRNFTNLQRG